MNDAINNFHLYLDTRNCITNSNPNSCNFRIDLGTQRSRVSQISLVKCSFANLYAPINSTVGNIFAWNNGVANFTVTVPAGIYTGTTFASTLQTLMQAAGDVNFATGTVTYSDVTLKLTFTPNAGNITILSPTTYPLNYLAGFSAATTAAATATSDIPVRLDGPEYVDVRVNFIEGGRSYHDLVPSSRVMARIYITEPYGNIIFYAPNIEEKLRINAYLINDIHIDLINPDGTPYTLPENAHVNYTFLLT